ncbi:MAG: peptidylprolyl isomerase [Candidatus Saccharimonadales bacterium]
MKPDFKQIKSKIKLKISRDANSQAAKIDSSSDSDIDLERESILEKGKKYVKPLNLPHRQALKVTAIILSSLVLAVVSIFAVLIYHYQSDSDLVYGASKVIPYPVGTIDRSLITYEDYLFELRTLKSSASSQIGDGQDIDFTTEEGQEQLETLKTLAMTEAQRKIMTRNLARENGIKVSRSDLSTEIDHFIEQEGGQEQLEQAIDSFFGWSMRDFRKVIKLQMLEKELILDSANSVLARAHDGEDFVELARNFSSDGSASEGGDLGFVDEDTPFVEEFKEAALSLEVGEISGLVETQFGFHVIKATEESDEGIRVSHILIDRSYAQRQVQERLEDANPRVFIDINI